MEEFAKLRTILLLQELGEDVIVLWVRDEDARGDLLDSIKRKELVNRGGDKCLTRCLLSYVRL